VSSTLIEGSRWGFEASRFGNDDSEMVQLERLVFVAITEVSHGSSYRSLKGGCRTLFTRSGETTKPVYELLQDLEVPSMLAAFIFVRLHIFSYSR
jgi:hypothetical protein